MDGGIIFLENRIFLVNPLVVLPGYPHVSVPLRGNGYEKLSLVLRAMRSQKYRFRPLAGKWV